MVVFVLKLDVLKSTVNALNLEDHAVNNVDVLNVEILKKEK